MFVCLNLNQILIIKYQTYRETINIIDETAKYESKMKYLNCSISFLTNLKGLVLKKKKEFNEIYQICGLKGFMNENISGFFLAGFLIIIDMPNDKNGFVKSITRSLALVIVNGAIARSASFFINSPTNPFHPTTNQSSNKIHKINFI